MVLRNLACMACVHMTSCIPVCVHQPCPQATLLAQGYDCIFLQASLILPKRIKLRTEVKQVIACLVCSCSCMSGGPLLLLDAACLCRPDALMVMPMMAAARMCCLPHSSSFSTSFPPWLLLCTGYRYVYTILLVHR